MSGTSQAKPFAALIASQRAPAPPVYRPQTPTAQGKVSNGSVPGANDRPASARFEVPQAIRPEVIQRMEEEDDFFWIPKKYYRPKAPTLGDWIIPALRPYKRKERLDAKSRAGIDRRQRLDNRYNFHDLTPATPVLDNARWDRGPLPSMHPAPLPAAAAAAAPVAIAPVPVVPPVVAAAPVGAPPAVAPVGTPFQRLEAICNRHFLNKHTANKKANAEANGTYYGGTVTVIAQNATNAAALEAAAGTARTVLHLTGWKVIRGHSQNDKSTDMKVAVFWSHAEGFYHLDFSI
jgi:hypothetical protein